MSELRKVLNTILNDKVSAEDCRRALDEFDGLKQAVADYQRRLETLKREEAGLNVKINKAQKDAEKIVSDAKNEAGQIEDSARETLEKLNKNIKDADAKYRKISAEVSEKESELSELNAEKESVLQGFEKILAKKKG
jgi:vacuolar-type H+-ATPase subunit H